MFLLIYLILHIICYRKLHRTDFINTVNTNINDDIRKSDSVKRNVIDLSCDDDDATIPQHDTEYSIKRTKTERANYIANRTAGGIASWMAGAARSDSSKNGKAEAASSNSSKPNRTDFNIACSSHTANTSVGVSFSSNKDHTGVEILCSSSKDDEGNTILFTTGLQHGEVYSPTKHGPMLPEDYPIGNARVESMLSMHRLLSIFRNIINIQNHRYIKESNELNQERQEFYLALTKLSDQYHEKIDQLLLEYRNKIDTTPPSLELMKAVARDEVVLQKLVLKLGCWIEEDMTEDQDIEDKIADIQQCLEKAKGRYNAIKNDERIYMMKYE